MLDLKNTFEGKLLAVFMSVVLVMSMASIPAFAGDEGEPPAVEGESTEQPEKATGRAAEVFDEKVVGEDVRRSEDAAGSDADALKATLSEPLVSTAVDETVVTFETENASVFIKDQLLSDTTLTVESHKDLQFTANADTGFELGTITAKNAANDDVPVTTQDGVSVIAADYVDSALIVTVAAAPVATDEPEDEQSEVPVVDEDAVEMETGVSSPAFEGYAQAGDVLVKITAAEGILPEGTTVQAVQVTSSTVMDAVENAVEQQGEELETAVAIDVTLVGPEGNVVQPSAPVNVCFFNVGIAGETMGVYHVSNDGSSVNPVSARQADASAQSFDVNHFSIYVVTVEGTPRLATYNFYGVDGVTLLDRQIVKTDDILYEPKIPDVEEGQSFQGWYAKNGSEWAGKFSAFGKQTVTGTATYNLYAKSSKTYYVYFMDNSGDRVAVTKAGVSGDVITTDVAFPLAPNEGVAGWYADKDRTNKVDSVELKDSSVTLYPKIVTGKRITFNTKGGSYVAPQVVGTGDVSFEPAEPTRSGYSFMGWYGNESCEGDAYSFGSGLAEDTTLYAKWKAAEAGYSVVVWLEAADSTHEKAQYDYVTTLDYQGTTDETVALPGASEIKRRVDAFEIDDKHIMDELDGSSDKTVTVKGDGTAIANVYLNRVEYTIDLLCTKEISNDKEDYASASTIRANYGADISAQWTEAAEKISEEFGVRVWVADPKGPGTTKNPVVAPFQTMKENRTLYYVKNGSSFHRLELLVEQVGNTKEIAKTDATDKMYNSGYRYSKNYDTSMFEIEDTQYFGGSGVHASIANYENALVGYEWVGADLASNQGFFNQGGAWVARHYFQRKAYTITFNNVGSVHTSEAIKYGWPIEDEWEEPSAKDAGVPEGSTFAGWYTCPTFVEGTEFDFADTTMPPRNLILYAKWVLPTYQVTYYAGMDGSSVATRHEVAYGKTTPIEPSSVASVPEGYKWVGWMTRSGSDGDYTYLPFDFDRQVYEDIELYPYYIDNTKYSVSYEANGGVGDVPTDGFRYAQGSFAEVAKSALSAPSENRTFLGWSTHIDGSGTRYYPGDMVQLGNADITLYAQWGHPAPQTSLTYDANGGMGDSATINLANNDETVLKTAKDLGFAAPRAGMHFAGWNTEKDGSGVAFEAGAAARVNADEGENVLYAQWALDDDTAYRIEVYYEAGGEYGDPEIHHATGTTDAEASLDVADYAKAGYTFDEAADNMLEGVIAGDGSLVLKAHFKENVALITYLATDGGSVSRESETLRVVSGEASGSKAQPYAATDVDPGYYFVGWSVGDSSDIVSTEPELDRAAVDSFATSEKLYVPTTFTAHFAAKKPLKILSESNTFTYDGTMHVASGMTLEGGDGIAVHGVTARVEKTNVGTYPVAFHDKDKLEIIEVGTGKDVTDRYAVTYEEGTLTIEKRPIALTGEGWSESQQYTGKAYASDLYKVEPPSGYSDWQPEGTSGLVQGQSVSAQYLIKGTVPGAYEGSFDSIAILDGDSDVTANYTIDTTVGALEIVASQKPLVITAVSKSWKYDGEVHSDNGYTVSYDGSVVSRNDDGSYTLPTGDTVAATVLGSVKNVADGAEGNNKITGFKVGNRDYYANVIRENGTLTITPRSVDLTSAAASKPYDGSPLTAPGITVSGDGWVVGEGADYVVTGSQTAVGSSDNTFDYTLKNGTAAANYVIAKHVSMLTVTSRPDDAKLEITVEANSGTFTYDGAEQSVSGLKQTQFTFGGATFTVAGLDASATGTNANVYDVNVIGDPIVTDEGGNVVTDQFAIKTKSGSLVIEKRPLTLESATLSKVYDGAPLTNDGAALAVEEGWADGEGATYVFTGSVTLPGAAAPNSFTIKVNDGTNLDNYVVSKTEGQLSVENRGASYEATVTARSATFTYDGAEHAIDGFVDQTAQGVPVRAGGRTYYVSGLISKASGSNVADSMAAIPVQGVAVVRDADGNDVSDQFNIKVETGSFTIDPAELVITANDAGKRYGDGDPALTASVSGLVSGDTFEGSYVVIRAAGENAGSYDITVSDVRLGERSNYTATTVPGRFVIAPAGAVTLVVSDGSKAYDGTPLEPAGFNSLGLAPGDTVEVVYGGSQTEAGIGEGTITSYLIRNAAGEDVTANYPTVNIEPGTLRVDPMQVVITVSDASKVAGTADPAFTGALSQQLANPDDLGVITYVRTGTDEAVGVYVGALTAEFVANPNYVVQVLNGTFTITAGGTMGSTAPTAPATPTAPTTPVAPTPLPAAPGTTSADNPVTPMVDALQGTAETVIGDNETPLAQKKPRETEIEDDGTSSAPDSHAECWVHWYIILGIIVTVLYAACVSWRRGLFSRKLKKYEDDLTGGGDPAAGAPSANDDATVMPKGAPAGETLADGLGE